MKILEKNSMQKRWTYRGNLVQKRKSVEMNANVDLVDCWKVFQ